MDITISGRHFSMNETLKSHTEAKIRALLDPLPLKISDAAVTFDPEGQHEIKVTVIVRAKEHTFTSENIGRDADIVFDTSMEKVMHQIDKILSKRQDHHG